KIASVPPYLLRSAFGHDGLWVFANRILANRIFSNRILAHRRRHWRGGVLARQDGGARNAQHGSPTNSDAQHGDEPGRAEYSKECSRHHSYELHHASPLVCRSPRTSNRGTPLFAPSGGTVSPLRVDISQSRISRATKFLTKG